jgi:hypothetical protein
VRQDCSLAKKQESRPALLVVVPGSRLVSGELGRLLAHGSGSAGHVRELSFSDTGWLVAVLAQMARGVSQPKTLGF